MIRILWTKRAAKHGRPMEILRHLKPCNVCNVAADCLGFDVSDEEYGPMWICKTCNDRMWSAPLPSDSQEPR